MNKASDLPQHVIDAMSPEDRREHGLISTDELREIQTTAQRKREDKSEKKIQSDVEAYLVHLGYEHRTPTDIARGVPKSGWQIHINKAKCNPILLDIVILQFTDVPGIYRCAEIELKIVTGPLSPEQKILVRNGAPLFRSSEEACEYIYEFHSKGERLKSA